MARDLGDFQTPNSLVTAVLEYLCPVGKPWPRVLEPTCGSGNFITGLLELQPPPREIQGIELQTMHFDWARKTAEQHTGSRVTIHKANIFQLNLARDLVWTEKGPLLVVGNPPWITNSELGALDSHNLPPKTNMKGLRGIDALTGESNFDITEYIWLKLLHELAHEQPTIALLCKTTVARKVLQYASAASLPIRNASIHRIDAKKYFGAAVEACLFRVELGSDERRCEATVYPSLTATEPESVIGIVGKRLVSNIDSHARWAFADGVCPLTWRQGLKHDAAAIMELTQSSEGLRNRLGESNFDITEYIWLKLLHELAHEQPTIALLCKTTVARKVLQYASAASLPIRNASIHRIDAKKYFGAAVEACLFRVELGSDERRCEATVYPSLTATEPESVIGIVGKRLVSNIDSHARWAFADGVCPLTWRQGLKHDAAAIMELTQSSEGLRNRLGELVDVESDYVYPLLKGSDVFHGRHSNPLLSVIVPQRRLGDDTRQLETIAPKLWRYLAAHIDVFERRKSSIYRGQPPFALFGIGDYSFTMYKVAVSGFYKAPRFRAMGPAYGKPVILDDTCYFIPCRSAVQAALLSALLNYPACLELIHSMIFYDSKRPVTKKLLQRIDLKSLLDRIDQKALLNRAEVEFKHLSKDEACDAAWPSPLDEFLMDRFPNAEHAIQTQMTF